LMNIILWLNSKISNDNTNFNINTNVLLYNYCYEEREMTSVIVALDRILYSKNDNLIELGINVLCKKLYNYYYYDYILRNTKIIEFLLEYIMMNDKYNYENWIKIMNIVIMINQLLLYKNEKNMNYEINSEILEKYIDYIDVIDNSCIGNNIFIHFNKCIREEYKK